MSTFLAGSYNSWSLRFPLGSSARKVIGLRRPMTADRAVMRLPSRRRPVTLSEWRGVLDALAALPTIASPGYGLPVEPVGATGGALTSPRVRGSQPDAGAIARPRSARNGRRLA